MLQKSELFDYANLCVSDFVSSSYKLEKETQFYNRQGGDEMISVGQSAVRILYFHGFIQCQSRHCRSW
jgi:hypothetical protein